MIRRDPTLRPLVLRILADNSSFKDVARLDRVALHTVDPDGHVSLPVLESDYRWSVAHGLMPDVVDVRQVVDNKVVDSAAQQLGAYPR